MLFDLQQILALPASPPSWLRFALEHNLTQIAAEHKVQRYFLRAMRQVLGADTAWYVALPQTDDKPMWDGADRPCDLQLVGEFALQKEPELPDNVLLAPVRVHGRLTAVVAAEKAGGSFPVVRWATMCPSSSWSGWSCRKVAHRPLPEPNESTAAA